MNDNTSDRFSQGPPLGPMEPVGGPTAAPGGGPALTEGPILRRLVSLAWPVFLAMGLHTLFHIVDSIWVGRIGPEALAAVTTCIYATWVLAGIGELLAAGVTALAARHVGARRPGEALATAGQAQLLAALLWLGLALLAPWAPDALFRLLGTEPEVRRLGSLYLTPLFALSLPALLLATLAAVFRAWGDTRTALGVTALSVGINLGLDPLLILGPGPFPAWGVAGAAWATIVSQTVGVVLFYRLLRRRFGSLGLGPPSSATLGRMVRIGLPVTVNSAFYALVYLWFAGVAARIDTAAVAVLGVGNRLESIDYILAESLSLAAAAFVGQNLGAGDAGRARRGAAWALALAFTMTSVIGAFYFLSGEHLFRIFTDDPAILERSGGYLRILALCQGLMGVEVTLYGIFAGAGYTLVPTLVSGIVHALRVPLASWIALHLGYGLEGLAWMITGTCALRALLLLAILLRGRWLHTAP